MVLCLELVRDWSIGTAPSSQSFSWSSLFLAEKFHKVPQALETMVREGERSWERRRERHSSSRRIFLKYYIIKTEKYNTNIELISYLNKILT